MPFEYYWHYTDLADEILEDDSDNPLSGYQDSIGHVDIQEIDYLLTHAELSEVSSEIIEAYIKR